MEQEGKALAQAIRALPVRGGVRVFSESLKVAIVAWYRQGRRQGVPARELAAVLGIHPGQLSAWSRRQPRAGFRPISLVDRPDISPLEAFKPPSASPRSAPLQAEDPLEPAGSPAPKRRLRDAQASEPPTRPSPTAGLCLVSPGGWRVEGLELATLLTLMERLS